jgi:hypothetical protein
MTFIVFGLDLGACNKAESKRSEGCGYLWSKSQINETQECDTQTLTLIKNMQTMLSELQKLYFDQYFHDIILSQL